MYHQFLIAPTKEQAPAYAEKMVAQRLGIQLATYLFPLLIILDTLLDKRLVQTSGKPIAQVARELGISATSIHQ